jgi:hypothetical protein
MAQYTIRLNLGGNIIQQLTRAEGIMARLNAQADRFNGGSMRGGGPSMLGGIGRGSFNAPPGGIRPLPTKSNFDFHGLGRNAEIITRNMLTPYGWARNAGKLVGAVLDGAAKIMASNPYALGIGGIAGVSIAGYLVPKLVGGAIYGLLSKALNSQSMTEAISNRMQMDMAHRGLGQSYSGAYNDATRMAAEYGYSRAGMLSMINTVSGLEVGGRQIGTAIATDIARMAGKVAQIGGRPYDIVGLNLQQLLSSDKPNMRDVRELIHAAPILSKYALEDMKRRGVTGTDPREWLQDRGNMLRALYRLDDEIQPPAVAAARGRVALAKENFWMQIAGMDSLWESVGNAGEKMFERLGARIEVWFSTFSDKDLSVLFDNFIDGVGDAVNALGTLSNYLINFSNFLSNVDMFNSGPNSLERRLMLDASERNQESRTKAVDVLTEQYANPIIADFLKRPDVIAKWQLNKGTPEEQKKAYDEAYTRLFNSFKNNYKNDIRSGLKFWSSDGSNAPNDINTPTVPGEEWKFQYTPRSYGMPTANAAAALKSLGLDGLAKRTFDLSAPIPGLSGMTGKFWSSFSPDMKDVIENLYNLTNLLTGNNTGGSDTSEIDKLTKGSKSLFINFNAPVVELSNTFNTSASAEEISKILEPQIIDNITRALHITINNATRTL